MSSRFCGESLKAFSPRKAALYSFIQHCCVQSRADQMLTLFGPPRKLDQLAWWGRPHSTRMSGMTPFVSQCSNQSLRSWMGAQSR